jgi:hypothetical protein
LAAECRVALPAVDEIPPAAEKVGGLWVIGGVDVMAHNGSVSWGGVFAGAGKVDGKKVGSSKTGSFAFPVPRGHRINLSNRFAALAELVRDDEIDYNTDVNGHVVNYKTADSVENNDEIDSKTAINYHEINISDSQQRGKR